MFEVKKKTSLVPCKIKIVTFDSLLYEIFALAKLRVLIFINKTLLSTCMPNIRIIGRAQYLQSGFGANSHYILFGA